MSTGTEENFEAASMSADDTEQVLDGDLLTSGQVHALADDQSPESPAAESESPLISDDDLRPIMAQFSPMALKDVEAIQKGVENFFLFHREPHALLGPAALGHLGKAELDILVERRAIVVWHYLELDGESGRLKTLPVLIRPASLKGEQIERVKEACNRSSAEALLQYMLKRDQRSIELEKEGRLGSWLSSRFLQSTQARLDELNINNRKDLVELIQKLRHLSVEHFLEQDCAVPQALVRSVLVILRRPANKLLDWLSEFREQKPAVIDVLANRGELPVLIELNADFHLFQPPGSVLIEWKQGKFSENRSELEWLFELWTRLAYQILLVLLPEDQRAWLDQKNRDRPRRFLLELQKHPVFFNSSDWEGGAQFLQGYERLLRQTELIQEVRREYLIRLVLQENLSRLNMRFEPFLLHKDELNTLDPAFKDYLSHDDLFTAVVERLQAMPEVLSMPERRKRSGAPDIYFIYKSNMPRAFVQNSQRRNFLHLFCKENGLKNGIYDCLIDVARPGVPDTVIEDQIALGKAIREWEAEQEKIRQKAALARMSIWERLLYYFRRLFGGGQPDSRRDEDQSSLVDEADESRMQTGPKRRTKRGTGRQRDPRPKEKIVTIPDKVQQAVDFVERNHHGLIWVDDVLYALSSVKYNENKISDLLYFDKLNRYTEIRSLREQRMIFVRQQNLESKTWIAETIDYLENIINPKIEYDLLLQYLEELLDRI
ncbi:MAG: hypothetical protein KDK39_17465 [Leptospiraceae bacterium]|nr:hypothetical protein [Leptospiraceae bacterium]